MDAARRQRNADKRGEDHKLHDARLQQLEEIGRVALATLAQDFRTIIAVGRIRHDFA